MTTSFASETELLTEHFGHPPISLIDDIINSVNILAERALNSVEQGLLNAPPSALGFKPPKSSSSSLSQDAAAESNAQHQTPADRARSEIEAGTHQLETLLCASIDRNFDKFELYVLRNIFTVRPPELSNWIRLSHYEGLDFSSSASVRRRNNNNNINNNNHDNDDGDNHAIVPADTPTIESITALRRRLRESMRLNALLTAERARNDALLDDLRRIVGGDAASSALPQVKAEEASSPAQQRTDSTAEVSTTTEKEKKSPFAFLHQKGDLASSGGGASAPLATTAAFTLSQMQALRALSTALSNALPDLKASTSPAGNGNEEGDEEEEQAGHSSRNRSWRRERAEYVEAATRRHLETMHGLELGRHGEVRDGEVRDGEWQGPGRSLARGEVEGLERVVAMLGGDEHGNGPTPAAPTSSTSVPTDQDGERMDES
ncbi:Mis12 protein-domain-containing protein [Xylaria venustula]|nr:Mis12 protein-domain-containing protein [Xylaria venustula]